MKPMNQRDNEIKGLIDHEFLHSLDSHLNDDTPIIVQGLLGAAHTATQEQKERIYRRIGELIYQHTLNEVTHSCTESVDARIEREETENGVHPEFQGYV